MIFSHQRQVALGLARRFSNILVVTSDAYKEDESLPAGSQVISSNWTQGRRIGGLYQFISIVIPILLKGRKNTVIFSHMTEVQSCVVAPLCWLLRIPHFLWYAHASRSKFLYFAYPFLTGVVTSTIGSCPIKGKKVKYLGQGVQIVQSKISTRNIQTPPLRWYHIGRLDSSKRIHLLIEAIKKIRTQGWEATLDLYGAPSSVREKGYFESLLSNYEEGINEGWLNFRGRIDRREIPKIAATHDGFIHAYIGSLDKALIEAALCKRAIVTVNQEFHNEFSRGRVVSNIEEELCNLFSQSHENLIKQIESNFMIASTNHTFDQWLDSLIKILEGSKA
jgi:glycosyltransferase involved in cell wall biosynthesis